MATITVPYEGQEKRFEIADGSLLSLFDYPRVPDPTAAEERAVVERALRAPIGSAPLSALAKRGQRVVILVDDWTRPTPAFKVLPVLLEQLSAAGCSEGDISIVVAKGMHRKLSRADMEQKVGKEVLSRFEVSNHDPNANLVHLGQSSRGTPVYINRTVVEADLRISVGSIVAHPIAGFGGGAKIIVPGVAGHDTIHHNHSQADHPKVTIGCVDGNPIREDMEDIARMAHLDLMVNTILTPAKKIHDAVAGDVVLAHREGVGRYLKTYGTQIKEAADIGVVGATPRDGTFGHATFALYAALPMVRPGGTIILAAPCTDGPGSKEDRTNFRELASLAPEKLMALIKAGEISASGGAFDYAYSKAVNKYQVVLVSDRYSRTQAEELGVGYGATLQEAVDEAIAAVGPQARVSVMPSGGLTLPIVM